MSAKTRFKDYWNRNIGEWGDGAAEATSYDEGRRLCPARTPAHAVYANILPATKMSYRLILDPRGWANRVRRLLPVLNVRHLNWFDQSLVDSLLQRHGWRIVERRSFARAYLDAVVPPAWRQTDGPKSHARSPRWPQR